VLLTPGAWRSTRAVDVRLDADPGGVPAHAMLHIGTAAHEVRVRPLAGDAARLTLPVALPLQAGDRAILRDPGAGRVVAGVLVVDADPPPLTRRGAGARRGEELAAATGELDLGREVARRGAITVDDAAALGLDIDARADALPGSVVRQGDWLIDRSTWQGWAQELRMAVEVQSRRDPLEPTLSVDAAREAVQVPDRALVAPLAEGAGLHVEAGRVRIPGVSASLGGAEEGLRRIEERLSTDPFAAPERPELEAAGLGPRQVAAAVRAGRLLRLPDDVLLLPSGPAQAMRVLAGLPQPFTLSEARQALGTTRRVAVPLLEHLDGRGWTRRVDASHRAVVR
jgi:selenocysteine-specific elongation factor